MQLTRPGCDCGYLGASFRAINRSITVDIGRANYSFADSQRLAIYSVHRRLAVAYRFGGEQSFG